MTNDKRKKKRGKISLKPNKNRNKIRFVFLSRYNQRSASTSNQLHPQAPRCVFNMLLIFFYLFLFKYCNFPLNSNQKHQQPPQQQKAFSVHIFLFDCKCPYPPFVAILSSAQTPPAYFHTFLHRSNHLLPIDLSFYCIITYTNK